MIVAFLRCHYYFLMATFWVLFGCVGLAEKNTIYYWCLIFLGIGGYAIWGWEH